jgi:hypothetical protein
MQPRLADGIARRRGAIAFQHMRQMAAPLWRGVLRFISKVENEGGLLRFKRILPRIANDGFNHGSPPYRLRRHDKREPKRKQHKRAKRYLCKQFYCKPHVFPSEK